MPSRKKEIRLSGIPVSQGIAISEVHLHTPEIDVTRYVIDPRQVEAEIVRFRDAIKECRKDIDMLRENIGSRIDEFGADIFEAHLLLLEDPLLITTVTNRVRKEKINVELALLDAIEKFKARFQEIEDPYIRERAMDIQDIGLRILKKLTRWEEANKLKKPAIVLAHDLTPSDTVGMDKELLVGFATAAGSKTSHTAILGRSFNIPAVVGISDLLVYAHPGDRVILDGDEGIIVINPTRKTLNQYARKQLTSQERSRALFVLRNWEAITRDETRITLFANIDHSDEVPAALANGADGIGLYRTEYLFIKKGQVPSEEEQAEEYRRVLELCGDRPVTIRTLDIGGDKLFASGRIAREDNPILGLRAIRFSFFREDIFRGQLRSLLSASPAGNLRILFPMISSVEEMIRVRKIVKAVAGDLKIPESKIPPLGAMIEVPAAAIVADHLADYCDFFSVGTNDLLQYSLAVDRGNELVANLYDPFHPANLRLLKSVVAAAKNRGIPVGVCGEMAGEPAAVPALLGTGIRELSVTSGRILEIKNVIVHTDMREVENLSQKLFSCNSGQKIREIVNRFMKRLNKNMQDVVAP